MNARLLFWLLARELRNAQLLPFILSLAVGVAAIVSVAGLADSVSRALRMEARPLLGADVAVRSFRPVTLEPVGFPDVERADSIDLFTMVAAPEGGRSLMAELKAVSANWPFYGAPTFEPAGPIGPDDIVVEPVLLERLGLRVGASVRVGGTSFAIRGVVTEEPGRLPSGMSAGPRVFMSLDGLRRAGLGDTGARITHRALFHVPDEARAAALVAWLKEAGGAATQVETWSDAQPSAQRSIARSRSFLGLVALLALLVGGVGVAQATRAWMARRLDALAIQRCLGLTGGEIRTVALVQIGCMAVVGSALGAGVGVGVLAFAPWVLDGVIPEGSVRAWQPGAIARGIALGVTVALLFAALPLQQAAGVSPLRVLRRDVEPMPARRVEPLWAVLGLGLFGVSWVQAGDVEVAAWFFGGLLGIVGAGTALATFGARALGRVAAGVRPWWVRHGLASVGRPGAGLVPAVVSLALGVAVVLTTVLVEGRIFAQISEEFPAAAPSAFLVDVQPDQRTEVLRLLEVSGASNLRSAPMVVARLLAVDDQTVDALVAARDEEVRWSLTREQRISYMPALPKDNVLVEGEMFGPDRPGEVSVEASYAESLGARVGSTLRFDVQGVPIDLVVSSIRTVSWESFDMNFFLIAEPGVLEAAPQSVLVTVQLPADREAAVQDALAAQFPNITLLSVRNALAQAHGLLERLAQAIRAVGAFTAAAGVAILSTGVAADAARRGREVALLKTLGTTRAGVVVLFGLEYAIVGALAGAIGTCGAWGVSYGLVTQWMGLSWRTDVAALTAGVVGTALSAAFVGVVANARALRVRPAEVLRGE